MIFLKIPMTGSSFELQTFRKGVTTIETKSHQDTLREEILAGRKFGGFGGFCPKPPN